MGTIYHIEDNIGLVALTNRFVLKLREVEFQLQDFDHIYINLSSVISDGVIQLSKRSIDKYHSFYRFIDIGLSPIKFNNYCDEKKHPLLINLASQSIQALFCENTTLKKIVQECEMDAIHLGEKGKIVYKRKSNDTLSVEILISILNTNKYVPYIKLTSDNGLNKIVKYPSILTQDELAFQFGSIIIKKSSAIIKPKANLLSNRYCFNEVEVGFN